MAVSAHLEQLLVESARAQALSLQVALPMLQPGITVNTSANDAYPIDKMQLIQFNGARYENFGGLFGGGLQ